MIVKKIVEITIKELSSLILKKVAQSDLCLVEYKIPLVFHNVRIILLDTAASVVFNRIEELTNRTIKKIR